MKIKISEYKINKWFERCFFGFWPLFTVILWITFIKFPNIHLFTVAAFYSFATFLLLTAEYGE